MARCADREMKRDSIVSLALDSREYLTSPTSAAATGHAAAAAAAAAEQLSM